MDLNLRMERTMDRVGRKSRVAFRLVNLVVAAVFLASAALQYNDESGVAWAALYFVGACLDPHYLLILAFGVFVHVC